MTSVFLLWLIIKALKNNNEYKEWLDFHPFKILLLLLVTSVTDWILIIKGIKYILLL